ncbi:MAG: hypothetical protein RL095_1299 [Verrucomicrobiota bacterium]|jgi:hypothetical protein
MTPYLILIFFSALVLCAFVWDHFGKRLKVPTVLFLLGTGLGLKALTDYAGLDFSFVDASLPVIGTIGLILIVLEGSMELEITAEKRTIIRRSLWAAALLLVFGSLALAIGFSFFTEQSFRVCMINAVPLAIISSAIAIPSAARLPPAEREFVIYESSFSDVLGVMLFSLLIETDSFSPLVLVEVSGKLVAVLLIALVSIILLAVFMDKVVARVRHLPVIASLILLYAVGGLLHLPALLIILAFGLYASNLHHPWLARVMKKVHSQRLNEEMHQLHHLTAEAAFFVRTVFFVFLGFSVEISDLGVREPWIWAGACLAGLILLRVLCLKGLMKNEPMHSLPYLMPRGLITILLFLKIPEGLKLKILPTGMTLLIVFLSVLWMSAGLWRDRKSAA